MFPEQLLQLQVLYSASQRALEARTRKALRLTIGSVLRSVLRDPRLVDSPGNKHVGEYLDEEIVGLKARLGQDRAVAVSRGLNFGLGVGALVSTLQPHGRLRLRRRRGLRGGAQCPGAAARQR